MPSHIFIPGEIGMIKSASRQTAAVSASRLQDDWDSHPRWAGVKRGYNAEAVCRLRGSLHIEHTLAKRGADKLWEMMLERPYVNSLGALTGNQAMQQVKAGVPAIYLSGWQVAADGNDSLSMYPDQSLYSVSSVPSVVKRINNALIRADQIQHMEAQSGKGGDIDFFAPIVADAEAGFGGVLNAYELMKAMIEAGAAVALATDFNPGTSPTVSLPLVMALGVSQLGLRHAEALTAVTVNAAAALGLAGERGQLAPGFVADLVVAAVEDWREVAYWMGANVVSAVWTGGSACPTPTVPVSYGFHVQT